MKIIAFLLLASQAFAFPAQWAQVDTDNKGRGAWMDFFLNASRGHADGLITVHKFGHNPALTTVEDIWDGGGTYGGWVTYTAAVRVAAGGNAADTAAGAGARTITVVGLDQNWAIASEVIALAGASASSYTSTTFRRIHRAFVTTSGTYHGNNTAAIVIQDASSVTYAHILAATGQTEMTMYTIPAGYTGYLVEIHVNVTPANTGDVEMWQSLSADTVTAPYGSKRIVWSNSDMSGEDNQRFNSMPAILEKTDLWFDATKVTGGGNMGVTATFDLILFPN